MTRNVRMGALLKLDSACGQLPRNANWIECVLARSRSTTKATTSVDQPTAAATSDASRDGLFRLASGKALAALNHGPPYRSGRLIL